MKLGMMLLDVAVFVDLYSVLVEESLCSDQDSTLYLIGESSMYLLDLVMYFIFLCDHITIP